MIEMNPRSLQKLLGIYLLLMSSYQGVYAWLEHLALANNSATQGFFIDPRLGISVLLFGFLRVNESQAPLAAWISMAWLALIGFLMLANKKVVKLYLIAELILSAPTIAYLVFLTVSPSTSEKPSAKELLFPLTVFIMFSILPMVWAWRYCLLSAKRN